MPPAASSDHSPDDDFGAAWRRADRVPGWLTRDQARVLHEEARRLPPGATAVEVGTHLGRSAIVIASALPEDGRLVAVDPFGPDWRYGRDDTEARCRAHLDQAGVGERVDLRVSTSRAQLAGWDDGTVGLVYVDGKHDLWSLRHDLGWQRQLSPGGTLLVHDGFSSLGVTLGLLRELLRSPTLRYVDCTGSLVRLEHATRRPGDLRRLLGNLPWFVRNLVVKALLRLRLRPLAGALGHRDVDDPY